MLTVFVATFVIFALVILGMSLGYLVKRKSIQGSCGGISSLGLEKVPAALRMPDMLLQFCRPGQAQPPPGIKRLRARWRCACRVCCFGFVGRVRR